MIPTMDEKNRGAEQSDEISREPPGDKGRDAAFKGRLSRTERAVVMAGVCLLIAAGVYVVRERQAVSRQREELLAKSTAEATTLAPREAQILELMRGFIVETAAAESPPDMALPEVATPEAMTAFLSRSGLYFRAAQP